MGSGVCSDNEPNDNMHVYIQGDVLFIVFIIFTCVKLTPWNNNFNVSPQMNCPLLCYYRLIYNSLYLETLKKKKNLEP